MNKTTTEELILRASEVETLKEEIANLEAFVNRVIAYDDLPAVNMVLEDIIKDAKTFKESEWQTLEPGEEW